METKTPKNELEVFARNISLIRKHYGLSKVQMAELLGISVSSIYKIEKGIVPDRLGVQIMMIIYNKFSIKPSEQFDAALEDILKNKPSI